MRTQGLHDQPINDETLSDTDEASDSAAASMLLHDETENRTKCENMEGRGKRKLNLFGTGPRRFLNTMR